MMPLLAKENNQQKANDSTKFSFLFNQEEENVINYKKGVISATKRIFKFLKRRKKPFSGIQHEKMRTVFEQININKQPLDEQFVMDELESIYLDHAVAFHLPKYIAHLNCPVVIPSLIGEQILSAVNSSLDTYDQSAGGTFIEQKLIDWTGKQIGFETPDGVFTSGGTQSNLMAVLLMRDAFYHKRQQHDVTMKGVSQAKGRLKVFCSECSHFSIKKSAALLGLGEEAVVSIPVSDQFVMDTEALESAILNEYINGNCPIGVVATAGTTDYGSIDPLNKIATIAQRYQIWFHVDAAVGGGLLLSNKHQYLLAGIEKSDSVTVDYHKTYFQTVSCSGFVVKDPNALNLISHHADYLNPKDHKDAGVPNQVDKSLQTTKRFDALKLWMTFRLMGTEQLGSYYDQTLELTKKAATIIQNHHQFELLNPPALHSLVFRFKPENMNDNQLNSLNILLRKKLFADGEAVVAGTKFKGNYYLKFTILNPIMTEENFEEILSILSRIGHQIVEEEKNIA
ncbi:pyridoxal phosphate-dependent decarboxylase family protein [Flammeovirga aprica]|uniref:Aspartate aminotransferase family protein n=1 Tax=Flammeovirga aprica JL-4 TaxID=694437 RepID=A0A7X9RT57_9BACT|nr:aspartate aminotransferase family protein [Flammeovirga aprica]NME67951.1 aspartate aminotransferase family protein [Flammeovirga aprica JL-4]